ncbi:alpha/beta hydrolase family protein (macronuclear) [Tetrahymena thermophila SB210]|uniref:Alpha/beta hydrolase family protein n=1 Tax=Tetrahymena thermophila (strain SB210) TaxID=312017 RepID=I7LXQ1_TETTS|nr:alpha/beta hydrolase family protein [Tetrahymena thermophila SB210]EAS05128.2 alpha/beta hydrolase family protein [Tetrahymena thermophila SB210]|eukprot:XP_001025373.2 alpha/beta hydrolase family protein [Tetrahymena thermophila SB210]
MDIFKNYESLWKSIIRPTRQTYNTSDLGPQITLTQESREKVKRQDFELKNKLGLTLKCSYYEFIQRNTPQPCVVYLHCNSGSRLEGQLYVDYLINKGISVCIFDFAGSGQSEGEYISLGYYELGDVEIVVNYLKQNWQISKIGIWGRSMGAVTGLMYIQNNSSIICGCFDSPFSNFMKLASEIGAMKTGLPKFLIKGALSLIQSTILEKAKFNIEELDVLKNLEKASIPCLFVASKQDSFVKSHHTEKIQKNYKGENKLLYFDGDHHEQRPVKLVKQCCDFFEQNLIKNTTSDIPNQIKLQETTAAQQLNQQQFDQSSPLQGKTSSTQSHQQLQQNNTFNQQQALQRSRIKSVQAPNLVNHLQSSVERGNNSNNNLDFYNSVKEQKSNQYVQQVPSSQPLIQIPSNNNIVNQTIHHAHSRSSTPNIQINLERKFNNVISSEQKTSGPAAPMIPQTAISAFENKQVATFAYKNFDQKNSSRINSLHQTNVSSNSNNSNGNIFNFNQPTQTTNNPLNIVLLQDNNNTPSQQQFISNQLQSNQAEQSTNNNSQQNSTQHQQQRSFTVFGQQQHINILGNITNNSFYGRERSNTSFTGALDFYKEISNASNNQNSASNSNIKNIQNQAPQTPLNNNQNINCDTSIDFGQSKIGSTLNSATPSCNSLARQQNIQNNIFRQSSSPHGGNLQQQQFQQQQMQQANLSNNKSSNQYNLYKSQSLNVNENLVTGASNQGENSIIVKSIPINYGVSTTNGTISNHMKKDSKTQFEMLSQPQSVESSIHPSEVQNRFRATTMDIIQPQRNEYQQQMNDQCLTPQSNTFTTNNITYKINRPRIQNNISNQMNLQNLNEQTYQKQNIVKQNSLVPEELNSNNNSIPASSGNTTTILNNQGSGINSSFNQNRNNQIINQMNNNNKSSINANNHSIVSLNEQQTTTLVSPRQTNNISIVGSVMNLSSNNLLANIANNSQNTINNNNNSSTQNNTQSFNHYVRIGQQMNKECKNENSKISNAEGDNESIISCDSIIINKNLLINNSSSKKPGTMNHTPVVCVTTPHHMTKSTNNNQQQLQNSGRKVQQSFQQNNSKNLSQSSQKYCNTLPSKNIDSQINQGNNNKYDDFNCFTPRNKKNSNTNNGTNQKNGSEKVNSASNQKSKSNKNNNQQNSQNPTVNQFQILANNNMTSSNRNTNTQIQSSNSKTFSKQNTNNILQSNQNVENKNKQQSAQKNTNSTVTNQTGQTQNPQNSNFQQTFSQNDYINKVSHQKNQSKFDFKNKRSANNVPIQRVKFTKNENVSPFQQENYNSGGMFKNITNVKVNLFDIDCKSPTNNQQGNCFNQTQMNKQDQNSNQQYLDNFVTAPNQLQFQQNEDKNNGNSNNLSKDKQICNNSKLNETVEINNLSKQYENKLNQTLNVQEDSKKNRSSTTPTFKPDFIRNLQNTKVVHILSKNEEVIQQNYIQSKIGFSPFNQYQTPNALQNQASLAQQNNMQNYNLQNQYSNIYNNANQNQFKNGFNLQSNQINNIVYMNQFK